MPVLSGGVAQRKEGRAPFAAAEAGADLGRMADNVARLAGDGQPAEAGSGPAFAAGGSFFSPQPLADRAGIPAAQVATTAASGTAVPIMDLGAEIAARAQGGRNRFEIRLDPPELGRIELRLDVDSRGQVASRLVVDRSETLDLLQSNVADLERALAQAGLKTTDNGLQFALRDHSFAGRDGGNASPSPARLAAVESDLSSIEAAVGIYAALPRRAGGIDIRV